MDIVKLAIRNARLTLSVLVFLIIAGALAYQSVPKEAEPDVAIPIMYVSLVYQGISPEDSERLLLRPVESQLKNLKGLKEMKLGRLPGRRLRAGRVRPVDRSRRRADRHPQQGAGRQARPAAGRRGADRQRGQHLRIPGAGRDAVRQRAGARADGRGQDAARPDRGSARRARRHDPGLARRTRRGDHRSGEAVLLRPAARPADPGHRRLEQPGRRRHDRGRRGQIRHQGAGADRDAARTSPTCRSSPARMPWCGCATSRRCARPSRMPRRSPGSTASRPSPSRSRSASAPTSSRRSRAPRRWPTPSSRPCRKAWRSPTRRTSRSSSTSC